MSNNSGGGRKKVGFQHVEERDKNENDVEEEDLEESSPREYRPFGAKDDTEESSIAGSSLASFPSFHQNTSKEASNFRDERMRRRSTVVHAPSQQKSDSKEIIKSGYLLKEGKVFRTWKNRYFVLRNKYLYYLEKQGGKVKGKFRTENSTVTEAVERKIPHCFKISTEERIWYLQAKSEEEMFSWIDNIIDYGGAVEILPDLDPKLKVDLDNFSDSDAEGDEIKPPNSSDADTTTQQLSSSVETNKKIESASERTKKPAQKLPSTEIASDEEQEEDEKENILVEKDQIVKSSTSANNEEEEPEGSEIGIDEEEQGDSTPSTVPKPKLTQNSATLDLIKKLAKDREMQLEDEDEPDEISETETDEMYDSDHEMYELLQNSVIPQQKKSFFEEPTPKRKTTENKSTTEVAEYKNLFNFFEEKSAPQDGKSKVDTRRKKKAILQTVPSNEQANVNYLEKVLEDISIVDKNGNLRQNLNVDELKASLREGSNSTQYYSSEEDEENGIGYKSMANEFKDLIILKSRPASSMEEVTSTELSEDTSHHFWDDFLSVFKTKQDHFCITILVILLVFITCILYLTQFFASFHQVKLLIMDSRETRSTWLVFLIGERLIGLMQEFFINSNQGIFSIVALVETSLSASGAFFIAFYSKTKIVGSKNSGETSPLFLDGYLGRVLQIGMTSLTILGLISSIVILGLSCLFFYILKDTMALNLSLNYILMRAPSIFLYLFCGFLHSFLFASLKIWQWLLVTLISSSTFFILLYTVVTATKNDPLFTMALIYDVYLLVHFLLSACILLFSDFRIKQKIFNFAQDIYTVGRNVRFQILFFVVNVIPFALELYNLLYFSFIDVQNAATLYTVLLIGFLTYLIQQAACSINSVSTIYGIRLVKRKQHNKFYLLILKSLIMNVIVGVIIVVLLELPPIQRALANLIIGQGIVSSVGEETKLVQTIQENMYPVFTTLAFCVPIVLLQSMYQSMITSFENFKTILFTILAAQIVIRVPVTLISSLAFQSFVGIPVGWAVAHLLTLFVYVLVVHAIRLPELNHQKMEMEKQKQYEKEFSTSSCPMQNKLLIQNK